MLLQQVIEETKILVGKKKTVMVCLPHIRSMTKSRWNSKEVCFNKEKGLGLRLINPASWL